MKQAKNYLRIEAKGQPRHVTHDGAHVSLFLTGELRSLVVGDPTFGKEPGKVRLFAASPSAIAFHLLSRFFVVQTTAALGHGTANATTQVALVAPHAGVLSFALFWLVGQTTERTTSPNEFVTHLLVVLSPFIHHGLDFVFECGRNNRVVVASKAHVGSSA